MFILKINSIMMLLFHSQLLFLSAAMLLSLTVEKLKPSCGQQEKVVIANVASLSIGYAVLSFLPFLLDRNSLIRLCIRASRPPRPKPERLFVSGA